MKFKIQNSRFKIPKTLIVFLITGIFLAVFPVLAQNGLVPCSGINCTLCDLFRLFQNIFNFVIRYIVPSVAVIGIAWGGYTLLTSGGREEQVKTGRKILINTFVGLAIAYGAFVVASSVIGFLAPDSARFSFSGGTFQLQCAASSVEVSEATRRFLESGRLEITIPAEEEPETIGAQTAPNLVGISGDNLRASGGVKVDQATLAKLVIVAATLKNQDYVFQVVSGYRTPDAQRTLIRANCQNPPGSLDGCNPKPGKPTTCILKDGPNSCPHTSGRAVDVNGVYIGSGSGRQCNTQEQCLAAGPDSCRENPCRRAVINAMRAEGFCNLRSEAWHFEYPKMSGNCN